MMPIERARLVGRDMDAIVAMVREQYAEHRPHIRYPDPARAVAGLRTATAGPLAAGHVRWQGIEYRVTDARANGRLLGVVAASGSGSVSLGRDELCFAGGDVLLDPPFQPYSAVLRDCEFEVVQIPWSSAAEVAAEHTGLPAASLRFESMSPVSRQAAAQWCQTVTFCSQQLLNTDATEISPILVQEMTRMTAAVLLGAFPNTIMTSGPEPHAAHLTRTRQPVSPAPRPRWCAGRDRRRPRTAAGGAAGPRRPAGGRPHPPSSAAGR